jgi:hypothetical protein
MPMPFQAQPIFVSLLDDSCSISGRNVMSDNPQSAPDSNRFGGLASNYPPRLPRKFKLLLPLKGHIEGLLAKRASYDDIRTLLKAANIVVSKNTVYRFCREVIGQKPVRQAAADKKEIPKAVPILPSPTNPPTSIQAALQEQRRERLPGLWGRRKRGPRIADSKNL